MKRSWMGMFVLAALVVGVLVAKAMVSGTAPTSARETAGASASALQPQVLLFGDPKEAEESCGCGEIFRMVRGASAKGVRTREVDPKKEPELARRYRVTVEPTVLFVDADGRETSRNEGESMDAIAALRKALDGLRGGGP